MEKKKIRTSFLRIFLLILAIFISFGAGIALGFVGGLVKDQPVLDQKEIFFISLCKICCVSSNKAPDTEKNKLIILVKTVKFISVLVKN